MKKNKIQNYEAKFDYEANGIQCSGSVRYSIMDHKFDDSTYTCVHSLGTDTYKAAFKTIWAVLDNTGISTKGITITGITAIR